MKTESEIMAEGDAHWDALFELTWPSNMGEPLNSEGPQDGP